jgi:hypothetical protein
MIRNQNIDIINNFDQKPHSTSFWLLILLTIERAPKFLTVKNCSTVLYDSLKEKIPTKKSQRLGRNS